MKKVTKKTTVGEIVNKYANGKDILLGFGLHCFGCPMSQMETVEEAAPVVDSTAVVADSAAVDSAAVVAE